MYYIELFCAALPSTTPQCTTLHYTALHCTATLYLVFRSSLEVKTKTFKNFLLFTNLSNKQYPY